MKLAILGRTSYLIETAKRLLGRGNSIELVWTSRPQPFYGVNEGDFRDLALEAGAAFRMGGGLSRPEAIKYLQSLQLDAAVSINWPTRISMQVINSFRYGVLNAHLGDLPRYRGNACPNWAILNGEAHAGLCIHQMGEEIDNGPIILRDFCFCKRIPTLVKFTLGLRRGLQTCFQMHWRD